MNDRSNNNLSACIGEIVGGSLPLLRWDVRGTGPTHSDDRGRMLRDGRVCEGQEDRATNLPSHDGNDAHKAEVHAIDRVLRS